MKVMTNSKKILDIVYSWGYIWFLSLNVIFCLWTLASNVSHSPHYLNSSIINKLCFVIIIISLFGFYLRRHIKKKFQPLTLSLLVLVLGLLWGGMFYFMIQTYNTPTTSLALLITLLLPATISFYISGRILILFCTPIVFSMIFSELTSFEKFNLLQVSGTIIIFAVVISARYILLEWYIRTQNSEFAKSMLIKKLTRLAHRDSLTGLLNKGSLNTHFEENIQLLRKPGEKLFMIIMDIDFFKQYNDLYGHVAGDECLVKTANCLSQSLRKSTDTAFRFGGEEFIVLSRCSHIQEAVMIADRIRQTISDAKIPHQGSQHSSWLSASFGVAQWRTGSSLEKLAEDADKELYKAKQAGRNQVSFART